MEKIVSIGLVLVVVLSLGAMAFADEVETTFQRGFGRSKNLSEDFEPRSGLRMTMSEEEFEAYRASNRINLSLNFEEKSAIYLAELIDLTEEEILESDATIHELAEEYGVLEELHVLVLSEKKALLTDLVEDGTISQEKADFMLERMSLMDGSQERLGRTVERGQGRGFGRECNRQ